MPPSPAPADPGRDDDLAWLDRDPERELTGWTGPASTTSRPSRRNTRSTRTSPPLTADELAEVREAAADELLAVEAATTGRRGPGQPGSARVFPGESCSPAAGSGRGWRWMCCRAARSWRWPPTPRPGMMTGSPGCPRPSWSGWCAPGTGSRPTRRPASWPRSPSWPAATPAARWTARVHRGSAGVRAGGVPARADELLGPAEHLDTRLPGTRAALLDGTITRSKAELIARATALLDDGRGRAPPSRRSWTGPPG